MFGRPAKTSSLDRRKRLVELQERVTILERLDPRERAKIGQEAIYHEAKEEIARLTRISEEPRPKTRVGVDLDVATQEVFASLLSLENFDRLPPASQKAFFGKYVEKVELDFGKAPWGKRQRTVLTGGRLSLRLGPSPECSGLGYSGGRI